MKNQERYEGLLRLLSEGDLDGIFLAPSSDLKYITGSSLRPDGRSKGVLVTREGRSLLLCPALYNEDAEELRSTLPTVVWQVEEGPKAGFERLLALSGMEPHPAIAFTKGLEAANMLELVDGLGVRCVSGASLISSLRAVKSEEELALVRRASFMCDQMMIALSRYIRPGLYEREIRDFIMNFHDFHGGKPRVPMVAAGANSDKPHYFGGNDRRVEKNDIVMVDSGGWYDDYSHDMTRTFFVGSATDEQRKVYDIVLRAQLAAEQLVEIGAIPSAIDAAARDLIGNAGYGEFFPHRLGHGIGLDGQEPFYISAANHEPLVAGNCFSIEPGIYLPDNFGVRIEDIVMVTGSGREIVNTFPKELTIL